MDHQCDVCEQSRPVEEFSVRGRAKNICRDCERARRALTAAAEPPSPPAKHSWEFKRTLRAKAFGWNGSALAAKRLAEAVKEIKDAAKRSPLLAGDGAVALCERIWPALQSIDSSSGALGSAVTKTVNQLVTILADAPASDDVRRRWLESLTLAIQNDGVDYLYLLRENWGRLCGSPALMNEWIDRTLPSVQASFTAPGRADYNMDTVICLSCLLESGQYTRMRALLDTARRPNWNDERHWVEALRRQGQTAEAIAYAESQLETSLNDRLAIMQCCETMLIESGRHDEAYERYALKLLFDASYINQFRALQRRYPSRDPRAMLLDLIGLDKEPGHWFAAAFRSGYLDIALECAQQGAVDPKTLIRAAQSSRAENPAFAMVAARRAIERMLAGFGFDLTDQDVIDAFTALTESARQLDQYSETLASLRASIPDQKRPSDVAVVLKGLLARAERI